MLRRVAERVIGPIGMRWLDQFVNGLKPKPEAGLEALAVAALDVGFGEDGIAVAYDQTEELYLVAVLLDQPFIPTLHAFMTQEMFREYGPEVAEAAVQTLLREWLG